MPKKELPKIIKKVQHFVADESGIISKENILKTGAILGSVIAVSTFVQGTNVVPSHINNISIQIESDGKLVGNHSHQVIVSDSVGSH